MMLPELFSTAFVINSEMIEKNGEDCYYYAVNESEGIVSVCDGCGGLGSKKYDPFGGKTGAYMASRAVSSAMERWFGMAEEQNSVFADNIAEDMRAVIDSELSGFNSAEGSGLKIKGSMVRPFPTTLASAVFRFKDGGLDVKAVWAGDSRVYALDGSGLMQLSADDIEGEDALSNLTGDGVLTNVISADGNYNIHVSDHRFTSPCVIFSATDGCFGYISTPMHFEYVLLKTLLDASCAEEWKANITAYLETVSGDDFTMSLAAFGFDTFSELKSAFAERAVYLASRYIVPLENAPADAVRMYWDEYRTGYYSRLPQLG